MITEWLISIGIATGEWFLGLAPASAVPVPPQVSQLAGQVNGFLASFGGLGVWVPWPWLVTCVSIAISVWAIALLVKGVAWLWGQIPVVGGSG